MFRACFETSRLDLKTIQILLDALTRLDILYLLENPNTPKLYNSGVRYRAEDPLDPYGERWLQIPRVLAEGSADCEDLASWRAAELCVQGKKARCCVTKKLTPSGRDLWHVRVMLPDGTVEDPSALLGMPPV